MLAKNPGLGRIRNLQAIWLAAQGELRFKQATAAQSKRAWKEAEESLQRAMDAFNLLEKDAALTGASTRR